MEAQIVITAAIRAIQADRSIAPLNRIIYTEMLFAAKRHLRDARLMEIRGKKGYEEIAQ